jgi:hypothetical protein
MNKELPLRPDGRAADERDGVAPFQLELSPQGL